MFVAMHLSLVIRQKGESKNGGNKKRSMDMCVSGSKKCSFFGKLAVLSFLLPPFLDTPFCLITDNILFNKIENFL